MSKDFWLKNIVRELENEVRKSYRAGRMDYDGNTVINEVIFGITCQYNSKELMFLLAQIPDSDSVWESYVKPVTVVEVLEHTLEHYLYTRATDAISEIEEPETMFLLGARQQYRASL